ncbi:MAG: alpha/beta hydrolase [Candidatus Binatia bacterium]
MRARPTLVLLHGGPGGDHSLYRPAFAQLADVCQVVYVDHRGQGRSDDGDRSAWTLAQWGDDVRTLCDVLGIERPIVLGTSFGGFVALSYATRHPGHAAKLALVSTSMRMSHPRQAAMFDRLGGTEARLASERMWNDATSETFAEFMRVCRRLYFPGERNPEADARVRARPAAFFHFLGKGGEGHTFDFGPEMSSITCPTLVMCGDLDPATPIEDSEDIVAALTAAPVQFERIADAGHPPWATHPSAIDVIRDFIRA